MKPDRPPAGDGFIDPLNSGKKHINFVQDPGRQNKLHNLQLRTFLQSSMCVNWQRRLIMKLSALAIHLLTCLFIFVNQLMQMLTDTTLNFNNVLNF